MCVAAGSGQMAAIIGSFQAGGTAGSSSTTLTITKPAGTVSGDLLLAAMSADGNATWTGDTGFTEIFDQSAVGGSPGLRIAYKVAGGAEGASYAFTPSLSRKLSGIILRIPNGAFDAVGAIGTSGSKLNCVAGAASLSSAGRLLAFFFSDASGDTYSTPAGMTLVASDTDGDAPSWAVFEQVVPSGSTGTRTATPSANGGHAGILVGIKAA